MQNKDENDNLIQMCHAKKDSFEGTEQINQFGGGSLYKQGGNLI